MVDQLFKKNILRSIKILFLISLLFSCNNNDTNSHTVLEPISSTHQYEEPPPPLPPDSTYPTLNQWLNNMKPINPSDTSEKIIVFRVAETPTNFYLTLGYFSNHSNDLHELYSKMKNMPIASQPNIQLQEYQKMPMNQIIDSLKKDIKKSIASSNFLNNNGNINKIILVRSGNDYFELYP